MIGLTKIQADLLAFIERFSADNGISPSFTEMQLALGLKSKSGVDRLLRALEERGRVRRVRYRARAIEVVRDTPLSSISTSALLAELERRGISMPVAA